MKQVTATKSQNTSMLNKQETFPQRLEKLREHRQIKRVVLSELCGLSRNAIGKYERGEQMPTLENAMRIADFFDVSLDYLIGHE